MDRMFARLMHARDVGWVRTKYVSYFDEMLDRFDPQYAQDVRGLRDGSEIVRGQESTKRTEEAQEEAAAQRERDISAEQQGGWRKGYFVQVDLPRKPENLLKAQIVVQRLRRIPSDKLTPQQEALLHLTRGEKGYERLLHGVHYVSPDEQARWQRYLLRKTVITMLEFAALYVGGEILAMFGPEIMAGLVGAGSEAAVARGAAGELAAGERFAGELAGTGSEAAAMEMQGTAMTRELEGAIAKRGLAIGGEAAPMESVVTRSAGEALPVTEEAAANVAGRGVKPPHAPKEIPLEPRAQATGDVAAGAEKTEPLAAEADELTRLEHEDWFKRQRSEKPTQRPRKQGAAQMSSEMSAAEHPEWVRMPRERYTGLSPKRLQDVQKTLESLQLTEWHHLYPKYLGGLEEQTLRGLPRPLHQQFHSELYAWKNGIFNPNPAQGIVPAYRTMPPEQIIDELSAFYKTKWPDLEPDFAEAVRQTLAAAGK
jgi:hypothetical protein